ncbi:hypothetical protein ES703_124358 [subsurface metagenome]
MVLKTNQLKLLENKKMAQHQNKFVAFKDFLASLADSEDNLAEEIIREKIRFQKPSLNYVLCYHLLLNSRAGCQSNSRDF